MGAAAPRIRGDVYAKGGALSPFKRHPHRIYFLFTQKTNKRVEDVFFGTQIDKWKFCREKYILHLCCTPIRGSTTVLHQLNRADATRGKNTWNITSLVHGSEMAASSLSYLSLRFCILPTTHRDVENFHASERIIYYIQKRQPDLSPYKAKGKRCPMETLSSWSRWLRRSCWLAD